MLSCAVLCCAVLNAIRDGMEASVYIPIYLSVKTGGRSVSTPPKPQNGNHPSEISVVGFGRASGTESEQYRPFRLCIVGIDWH